MSQENEFDNAFKERLSNMDFEFKDAYWTEMSALMDGKRKRRGLLFWWISMGSVAAIVLLFGAIYFVNSKDSKSQILTANQQVFDASATKRLNQVNRLANSKNSENEMDQYSYKMVITGGANQVNASTNDRRGNSEKTQQPQANQHWNMNNQNNESQTNQQQNQTHQRPNETENAALGNNNMDFQNLDFIANKMIYSTFDGFDKSSNLAQIKTNYQPVTTFWNSHVGIVVGATFGQSLNDNSGSVGGLGTHAGLRFYFATKKGFMLNTGLSLGTNQIKGLQYQEMSKIYGFTQYEVVNTIKYNSMLSAYIPIFVGYEGSRFAVAGGLRLNYIMNTKGKVYTWDNTIYDQNIWGYANGIKYFNMAAGIEASYRIARRWDIGTSLDLDLSSRSEENSNLISPNAQLWQAGFFVKYRLN